MSSERIKVELIQGSIPFRSEIDGFSTYIYSPFQDFYDIYAEENAVKEFISQGVREGSVEDMRVLEFQKRKEMLEDFVRQSLKLNGHKVNRKFVLSDYDVKTVLGHNNIISVGRLVSEVDSVKLQTTYASGLIFGKRVNREGSAFFNTGMMTASRCLAEIYEQSSTDNPFVDQALVYVDLQIDKILRNINKRIDDFGKSMQVNRERGINLKLLKNEEPREIPIIVHSPYSYKMVELVTSFDIYVLWVITFQRKGLKSKEDGFNLIREVQRDIRNLYVEIKKLIGILSNEHIASATRGHWLTESALKPLAMNVRNSGLVVSNEVLCNQMRPWNFLGKRSSMSEERIKQLTVANNTVNKLSESTV